MQVVVEVVPVALTDRAVSHCVPRNFVLLQAFDALDRFTVSQKRRTAPCLCFYAIPDRKPLHTFPGIALPRPYGQACRFDSNTQRFEPIARLRVTDVTERRSAIGAGPMRRAGFFVVAVALFTVLSAADRAEPKDGYADLGPAATTGIKDAFDPRHILSNGRILAPTAAVDYR